VRRSSAPVAAAASIALTLLGLAGGAAGATPGLVVERLRWDGRANPLGIVSVEPRLSWAVASAVRGQRQTAYQVLVARDARALAKGRGDLWDSGKVASDQSMDVRYGGTGLGSRESAYWKVRVWDRDGRPSGWSAPASVEMALFDEEWSAHWIGPPSAGGAADMAEGGTPPPSHLRKAFTLPGPVVKARLYVTAFGLYQMTVNGRRVGGDQLTPGWTDYDKRIAFQTYDVTSLLRRGDNVLGAILADGWYAARFPAPGGPHRRYGSGPPRMFAQLEVMLADGRSHRVPTDLSWKVGAGPLRAAVLREGETFDARRDVPGWDAPGFDDSGWVAPAEYETKSEHNLVPRREPSIVVAASLAPVSVTRPRPGVFVHDFGRVIVGRARLRARGTAGTTVVMRFAEALDGAGLVGEGRGGGDSGSKDGRVVPADRYILSGRGGEETWEPSFVVHRFRYVEVSGLPGMKAAAVTARLLDVDAPVIGRIATSDPRVDGLVGASAAAIAGGFLGVPTTRARQGEGDDGLGWMADAQAVAQTACLTRDLQGAYAKWASDLRDAQDAQSAFPDAVPRVRDGAGSPGWADAGVTVPWTAYVCFGDRRLIEDHSSSAQRWIHRVGGLRPGFLPPPGEDLRSALGDRGAAGGDITDPAIIATAFFAHTADLAARAARAMGHSADAGAYESLFRDIKEAFGNAFVAAADGRIKGDTQTAYALALGFGLVDGNLRERVGARLLERVARDGGRLTAGVLGAPHLLPALSSLGRDDVAFSILTSAEAAPWAPVLAAWVYGTLAGLRLDPAHPGGKHVFIQPRPAGGLTHARASYESVYGTIAVQWRREGGAFRLRVDIPANTTATVTLPFAGPVTESDKPLASASGVVVVPAPSDSPPGATVVRVKSGRYDFRASGK